MSSPIRVGIIGLSVQSWAAGAHAPYLLSSPRYKIVAIANSSVESAQAAIGSFDLPASTRAYGNPEDIANDLDVDLIVDSVRVDRHLPTSLPSLKTGKKIFIEWPLGKNLAEAEELLKLKNEANIQTAYVDLQARFSPLVLKVKSLIKEGRIGKVLSSTVLGQAGNGGPRELEAYAYLLDKNVGGNVLTIHFGHIVDYVQHAIGELELSSSLLANRRPTSEVLKQDGTILKDVPKTTDDQIHVISKTADGAPVSIILRGGKPFKGTPALDWRIYGQTGEIRVTAPGIALNIGFGDKEILEVHDFASDEVEVVAVPSDELSGLPGPAANVGRVYEAIAKGDVENLVTFEEAVERHRFIDALQRANA